MPYRRKRMYETDETTNETISDINESLVISEGESPEESANGDTLTPEELSILEGTKEIKPSKKSSVVLRGLARSKETASPIPKSDSQFPVKTPTIDAPKVSNQPEPKPSPKGRKSRNTPRFSALR